MTPQALTGSWLVGMRGFLHPSSLFHLGLGCFVDGNKAEFISTFVVLEDLLSALPQHACYPNEGWEPFTHVPYGGWCCGAPCWQQVREQGDGCRGMWMLWPPKKQSPLSLP